MSEEMKMSDVFVIPCELKFSYNIIFTGDRVKYALHAINNHDRLTEENARLTDLAAQKASRADELYSRLDKSQMLINSVGLIFMNDMLSAKEKEKQLKGLFDIHGDEIYLDNRELLDKIKQESNDESI